MKKGIGVEFTAQDKKKRTIYIPQMLEYHSLFLQAAFERNGYRFGTLHSDKPPRSDALRYISNDYCYPSVLIVGQMIEMLRKNENSTDTIAFMEPQAGGSCRAGNIYHTIVQVVEKLGYQVPVLSLNYRGQERHSGFHITPGLVNSAATAVCCGDLLMALYQQTKPYEKHPGETDRVYHRVEQLIYDKIRRGGCKRTTLYRTMLEQFKEIERYEKDSQQYCGIQKVGVAGEIYIKFSSIGNNNLERYLREQRCAPYFGGFLNYCIFVADCEKRMTLLEHPGKLPEAGFDRVIALMEYLQKQMYRIVWEDGTYTTDFLFSELKEKVDGIISTDCVSGDGWLVAAEVVQAIEKGAKTVLIVHPFGCLVSHVCERGILKKLKERYKDISIQTIEYDYDSSDTLRESRILMALQTNGG